MFEPFPRWLSRISEQPYLCKTGVSLPHVLDMCRIGRSLVASVSSTSAGHAKSIKAGAAAGANCRHYRAHCAHYKLTNVIDVWK